MIEANGIGKSVLAPLVWLVIFGGLIGAVHELQILAYRPPDDMSTLLGGPEETVVSFLIGVLAVWVGILVWCIARFRRKPSAA